MTLDRVIRASRAVIGGTERACAIGIANGRVAVVARPEATLEAYAETRLADDEVLLPGLVDTHVHVNEPGRTEWEGFETATRAAAAGGFTAIVDMPLNSIPPTTTVEALAVKRNAARHRVHVDVAFWGGVIPGNRTEIAALHAAGVVGFKCFLADSGVPEFPPLNGADFAAAMTETARLGALMIVHAEDVEVLDHAPSPSGPAYRTFLQSRPADAEGRAVARVIDATKSSGGRAHIVHLSSADALNELRAARAAGVKITVETCPHYLTLAAEAVPDGATLFKCCPPIRERANQERLWAGLAAGDIDMVVSDHSPCPPALKHLHTGDFGLAWGGISSLELGLSLVWTAARTRGCTLVDVARWMAATPADIAGLRGKGRIAVGADADFAVLAPDVEFVVTASELRHRNPLCPYLGMRLRGVVQQTWLRGELVDPDGPPRGRLLTRGPS